MASAHPLVERFKAGDVPEHLKLAAARGALPLPPEDLLAILFHLRQEASAELLGHVTTTVAGLPEEALVAAASESDADPAMLDFISRAASDRTVVLEAVVLNAVTADSTIQHLAEKAPASLLDLIALNQVRLQRSPAILQAILGNSATSLSLRRRLKEVWELSTAATARARGAAPAPVPAPTPAVAPPPSIVAEPPAAEAQPLPQVDQSAVPVATAEVTPAAAGAPLVDALAPDDLGDLGDLVLGEMEQRILEEMRSEEVSEDELRLAQRLLGMSIPERVQLATMGDREARGILIRDSSKMVQEAVINSPKITESEIEKISNMRSISEDLMRMIATSRDFTKNYTVCHNLVRNPKTPRPLAMTLMQRLQSRDLTVIMKDKNIPDVVRRHAAIIMDKRTPGKKK